MNDEPLDDEMLRELERRTAELPREIAPPPYAWARIKETIESDSVARPAIAKRNVWLRPPMLAAAALLLVAAGSFSTMLLMRRSNTAQTATISAPRAPTAGGPANLAQFTAMENDYIATTNRLSAMIESGQADLAPETIAKLKESLRVIDAAILEARRALAADPANKALMEMLSTSYGQKVDLLRRTAEMGRS